MWLNNGLPSVVDIRFMEIHEKDYTAEDYFGMIEECERKGEHYSASMIYSAVCPPVWCGRSLSLREDEDYRDTFCSPGMHFFGEDDGKTEDEIKRESERVNHAIALKNRIFDNMDSREYSDDAVLDDLEKFALENNNCEDVVDQYRRAIKGVCGGIFRVENTYYDEIEHQRKRYEKFLEEFPTFHSSSVEREPDPVAILNGLAFSHILQKRDGTVVPYEEALNIYQSIFDELQKDEGELYDGYFNILYSIARDSAVYFDRYSVPLYEHFEDRVIALMRKICDEKGEREFGEGYLLDVFAMLRGCYYEPLVKNREVIDKKIILRILEALVHLVDRLHEEFPVVLTGAYVDPTTLGHDIRLFAEVYLKDLMDEQELRDWGVQYRKTCVGIFYYDPRNEEEPYKQVFPVRK